jgi:hypothetical protein
VHHPPASHLSGGTADLSLGHRLCPALLLLPESLVYRTYHRRKAAGNLDFNLRNVRDLSVDRLCVGCDRQARRMARPSARRIRRNVHARALDRP